MWWSIATQSTWTLSQKDLMFGVIMVGILFLGMYVLFRLMVAARHPEPIFPMEDQSE